MIVISFIRGCPCRPRRAFRDVCYRIEVADPALFAAVRRALDETETEYGQLPLFVRIIVRRGFTKRTGLDFAGWRALLDRPTPALPARLAALADHYRGAPERARRGMGATAEQMAMIEERSRSRAEAADALRRALAS